MKKSIHFAQGKETKIREGLWVIGAEYCDGRKTRDLYYYGDAPPSPWMPSEDREV